MPIKLQCTPHFRRAQQQGRAASPLVRPPHLNQGIQNTAFMSDPTTVTSQYGSGSVSVPAPLTGLTVNLTPQLLSNPKPFLGLLDSIARLTTEDIMIVFVGPVWSYMQEYCPASRWNLVQRFLGAVYGTAAQAAAACGRPDVNVSVYFAAIDTRERDLHGMPLDEKKAGFERGAWVYGEATSHWLSGRQLNFINMQQEGLPDSLFIPPDDEYGDHDQTTYDVAALGGTFDHLHAGHKVLLTMGVFLARKKLIVGVSGDELLTKKSHAELVEPIETRMANVRDFLVSFNPHLEYDVVPIHDVYGPTATDPNIQALVLSTESAQGGDMVTKARQDATLPPLKIFSVDVVHSKSSSNQNESTDIETLKELKMGSSHIRAWLAASGRNEGAEEAAKRAVWLERWKLFQTRARPSSA